MRRAGAQNSPGKLTTAQQEYVVERLAAFDSPDEVMRSLREQFGITLSRNSIIKYDPTRYPGCPARWKLLFDATRQAILQGKGLQGALNRAERLRSSERSALRAIETLAGSVLDDIVRQVEAGSAPPSGPQPAGRPLTDEERTRAIVALLAKTGVAGPEAGVVAMSATDEAEIAESPLTRLTR